VSFEGRRQTRAKAKSKIAAKLRPMVPATGAIGLDASSTVLRLAGLLDRARDLIVVTNGRDAFGALQDKPGINPLLTGGTLEVHTGSLVGPLACRGATSVLLHRVFLSAAALDPRVGSSETTINDAEVKRAMVTVATDVVLAVDAAKLNSRALAPALEWDRITTLVTDLDPQDERLAVYRGLVTVL
jgi:DeoR family fructose operon transcriptional repressor